MAGVHLLSARGTGDAPFTAVNDSGDVNQTAFNSHIETPYCTATPVGGRAPYTYLWTKLSGDAISIDNPTAAATFFFADSMHNSEERTALFRCTVTDALGASQHTRDVFAEVFRDAGGGA